MRILILIIKKIVVILIVVLFLLAAYFFLFLKGDKSKLPNIPFLWKISDTVEVTTSSAEEFAELQQHLSNLKSVNIDSDFFNSNVFESLKNFKEPLPELKQGRVNPFAPIGEDF